MKYTVSEFIAICNQTLDYAYPSVTIVGEVSGFTINQGKWVFFDLKDEESSLSCFLPLWDLRAQLADGMQVILKGVPKLTAKGKFSLTVKQIMPVGEGSIKKSFELLKQKLTQEGLFDPAKKRPLPPDLQRVGVISSTQAAGYQDFIKILNERWGGLQVQVAHTGVQGLGAADQIIRALKYFNEQAEVQIIALLRGGGSADDLAVFNDEALARVIATSRIPVITGIGHEKDESLADLAADIRASTPSNAAQLLTPDRQAEQANLHASIRRLQSQILSQINQADLSAQHSVAEAKRQILAKLTAEADHIAQLRQVLEHLNPEQVLAQGYAIVSGQTQVGAQLSITTKEHLIKAEVQQVSARKARKE